MIAVSIYCYLKKISEKKFENQNKISWWWSCNFYDKEIPKANSNHTCLAVISMDSALKKDKNYYPQVFSKRV